MARSRIGDKPTRRIVGAHLYVPRDRNGLTPAERRASERTKLAPLPATRGDCPTERPCPHVRCRYHLSLDVHSRGSLIVNHPGRSPDRSWVDSAVAALDAMPSTCSLDVADEGGAELGEIAELLNVSHERVRQILADAIEGVRIALSITGETP